MRPASVRPTGVERTFDEGQFIVSKTDAKGIITYANSLFLDVARYAEEEVIGKPHNILRHPDMPRAVFKLLWDRLETHNEVFAYIVNLAGDGAHYWVFAHVTPTLDRTGRIVGHHSNRRVPSPAAVRQVEPIYRALLAEEKRHGTKEGLAASTRMLTDLLEDQGQTYDEFVWGITGTALAATR
jgi:PAS domain S-box-containing protein